MTGKVARAENGEPLPTEKQLQTWDKLAAQMTREDWEKWFPERRITRDVLASFARSNARYLITDLRLFLEDKKKALNPKIRRRPRPRFI